MQDAISSLYDVMAIIQRPNTTYFLILLDNLWWNNHCRRYNHK